MATGPQRFATASRRPARRGQDGAAAGNRWPVPAAALGAGIALALGIAALWIGVVAAQAPWPTPPPGPPFPHPLGSEAQAPVQAPQGLGNAEVFVVRPSWPGPAPLVPPLPSRSLVFTETGGPPVTVRIEAGAYAETVQVAVRPYTPQELDRQEELAGRDLLLGLKLEVFNKNGQPMAAPPRRPILVIMPTEELMLSGLWPGELLWVTVGDGRPRFLPTQYHMAEGLLSVRLTEFHHIALAHDVD